MKKITSLLIVFVLGTSLANATSVTLPVAKSVAENFYKQNTKQLAVSATLAYTASSSSGDAVFYAFNINQRDGFVIVAAEDNAHPILGYSTEGQFVAPQPKTNISYWLTMRKKEILNIRAKNYLADNSIIAEWNTYKNNTIQHTNTRASMSSVSPLVHTSWNQSPYYNDSCPSSSVTGCVATAMAQIMKFWNYPATGTGSSSYCDCSSGGFTNNYGTFSANYGATTYNWSNMPMHLSSHNSDVAQLMYQCGVSVQMDYDPNGSAAWVITADNPSSCAQISYVNYFKYDPTTIQGLYKSDYSDAAWVALLKNDLDIGRPIQYVGDDSTQGGHTWVCDGYDVSDNFHMNWGWGGADNGYYPLTNLNTGGYNPVENQEALIGIQPIASIAVDAGIPALIAPSGTICSTFSPIIKLKNYGINTLTSCVVNYTLDNGAVQTQNWSGSLASGQFASVTLASVSTTPGVHSLTVYTTNPNGATDGNPANDQSVYNLNVTTSGANLPLVQGFESSTNLPTGWTLSNPDGDAAWQVVTTLAHTGTKCIGFDNCDGNGQSNMSGKIDQFRTSGYNFANATSPVLNFDVSASMLSYSGTTYSDTLNVYYSTDCGGTWTKIYSKSGTALATAPLVTSISACWSPTATEWRTETVSLSSLVGQPSVLFAFENRSGWASWLYIDNINISANSTTGIDELNSTNELSIYPNPASTTFTIAGANHTGKVHYALYDVSGREVKVGDINSAVGAFNETISISDLSHGMYFLKAYDEQNAWTKKLEVK